MLGEWLAVYYEGRAKQAALQDLRAAFQRIREQLGFVNTILLRTSESIQNIDVRCKT